MLTVSNAKRLINDWLIDCTIDTDYSFDICDYDDICDAANSFMCVFENVIFEFEMGKDIEYIKDIFNNTFPIEDNDWITLFQAYVDLNKDVVIDFINETCEIDKIDKNVLNDCGIDISKIKF